MNNPIYVVGLGVEFPPVLGPQAEQAIATAQVLIGGKRLLAPYQDHQAQKIVFRGDMVALTKIIETRGQKKVVVLASGDPGFHGIASSLLKNLPGEDIRIFPNVSSLQATFARIGIGWDDAVFTSVHAHPLAELAGWIKRFPKIGVLTDQNNAPAQIAEILLEAGIADCRAAVAENIGIDSERLIDTCLSKLVEMEFAPLNVLLILQDDDWQPQVTLPYRSDEEYEQQRGLITKQDVRALSIARLAIQSNHVLWDIGAGSGALSVEMAQLAWRGQVYAVEREPEGVVCIESNRRKFGALNLHVIAGEAPQALAELPQPNRVFIGGSGGNLAQIIQAVHERLTPEGIVVCNFATIDNLHIALAATRELGWLTSYSQVNIAHSKPLAALTRLEPLNPIFIFEGRKK